MSLKEDPECHLNKNKAKQKDCFHMKKKDLMLLGICRHPV